MYVVPVDKLGKYKKALLETVGGSWFGDFTSYGLDRGEEENEAIYEHELDKRSDKIRNFFDQYEVEDDIIDMSNYKISKILKFSN